MILKAQDNAIEAHALCSMTVSAQEDGCGIDHANNDEQRSD